MDRRGWLLGAALASGCLTGCAGRSPAVETPVGGVDYRNVAAEAGLRYTWGPGPSRLWTNRDGFGAGCAFLDYDQDGWQDILLAGHPRCALFRNNRDGTFTEVSRQAGVTRTGRWSGIAVGDYDGDGFPDVFVAGQECAMLLHNQQGRGFRDVTRQAGLPQNEWGTSSLFFDADEDGDLDLVVGHYVVTGPEYPEYCPGRQGVLTGCAPKVYPPQFPRLYRNDGGHRFRDVTPLSGLGMAHGKALAMQTADFDGDGRTDLYIANDGEPGDLFRSLGGGRFQNVGMQTGAALGMNGEAPAGMGVDFGDYDRDGRLDLVVTTFRSETYSLFRNQGHTFQPASFTAGLQSTSEYLGFGTRFFDYDSDGWPDLVFANGHVYSNPEANDPGAQLRQPTLLYRNERGTYARVPDPGPGMQLPIVGRGLAVGDTRNDGSRELLIVDQAGSPLLLRNHRRSSHHWLGVELRGKGKNRFAYGARVTVKWAGGESFADCTTAGSYLSASDPRLHFGLGAAGEPVSVTVRWPSGRVSKHPGVSVDRYVRLTEP